MKVKVRCIDTSGVGSRLTLGAVYDADVGENIEFDGVIWRAARFEAVDAVLSPPEPPKPQLTVEQLARAIFDTDERVKRDVSKYAAEKKYVNYSKDSWWQDRGLAGYETLAPYFDKAWSSNRNGWKQEALDRAAAILSALESSK